MTKAARLIVLGATLLAVHGPAAAATGGVSAANGGWRNFTADWGCAASAAMTIFFGSRPGRDGTCAGWRVG